MAMQMTGKNLTVEKIVKVARDREKIAISPEAMRKIEKCREIVETKVKERAVMYGATTGIGELSEEVLDGFSIPLSAPSRMPIVFTSRPSSLW